MGINVVLDCQWYCFVGCWKGRFTVSDGGDGGGGGRKMEFVVYLHQSNMYRKHDLNVLHMNTLVLHDFVMKHL